MYLPGEPRASRSRPGSRQKRGGSAGAHSNLGLHPPPHCDTEESDHGCPCSLERPPTLAASEEEHQVCRGQNTQKNDAGFIEKGWGSSGLWPLQPFLIQISKIW